MKDVMLEFLIVYLHIYKKSVSYKETIKLADCPINKWNYSIMLEKNHNGLNIMIKFMFTVF